jgi:hypothetical protein
MHCNRMLKHWIQRFNLSYRAGRGSAHMRPLAPPLLLERLLQNGDLAVAGGVHIELTRGFQGIGIKEEYSGFGIRSLILRI